MPALTQNDKFKITSNDFTDLFIRYNRDPKYLDAFPGGTTQIINDMYAISYVPATILDNNFIKTYLEGPIPHCYGLTSQRSISATGIDKLRGFPDLNLRGKGVIVGVIDTGIDYTNPIFIRPDGTSKVVDLWDQTIDSEKDYPANTLYGTQYSGDQISQALKNANPFTMVPSKDDIGHGTMLAGLAVGSEVPASKFSGVVPDADLIIVKLKQAKVSIRKFYEIPLDVPCYQENDILWALQYMIDTARRMGRPLAICIGLGSSMGSHDGRSPVSSYLSIIGDYPGITVSVSAGNEGDKRRHFHGNVDPAIGYSTVELNVGENEQGFTVPLWGGSPNTYSIELISPSGETTGRIAESLHTNRQVSFVFEVTTISIDYQIIGTHAGEQIIVIRFHNPVPGLWVLRVYSIGDMAGSFHMWLPSDNFISNNTYFIQSNPYITVTAPGDSTSPITVTAYNPDNETLFLEAGRGYTRSNTIKPELAAPGVAIVVPTLDHGFTTASGTGLAAAFTAGVTAMMLEWGIVRGAYPDLNSVDIKKFLIRGAKRSKQLQYPNRDWGYGMIDVFNVFNILRTSFPK